MEENMISMDGGKDRPRGDSLAKRFMEEGWPKLPVAVEWDKEKGLWKYMDTFCLGCKETGLVLSRIVHIDHDPECNGAVVVIHKDYHVISIKGYPPDDSMKEMAKRKVEEEIEKLRNDEEYLDSVREKFSGFMANWKKEKVPT